MKQDRAGCRNAPDALAEQLRGDRMNVDSAEVQVDLGPQQLYVAEAHGVAEWSVEVQAPLSVPHSLPTPQVITHRERVG
jgi:hypothetical protein